MGALLFVELILAILAFVFTREIKAKVVQVFQMEGLVRYRDSDDLRNLIDWTQKTVSSLTNLFRYYKFSVICSHLTTRISEILMVIEEILPFALYHVY